MRLFVVVMVSTFLIVIIYASFVALGLPDSLLGSTWAHIRLELGVPLSYQGILSMIVSGGTIVSSLLSNRMNQKFGTGVITMASTVATAVGLLGFSFSTEFWMLCAFGVICGLGAGGVDAALNNYVALHYSSRHMNWLHCFWGVGTIISPQIMGVLLKSGHHWTSGYFAVAILQGIIAVALVVCLPLWKKGDVSTEELPSVSTASVLKVKGVVLVLVMFFCYCAAESIAGIWASSYLVEYRHIDATTATLFGSLFFAGITAGRFICGLFSEKFGDKRLIWMGTITCFVALVAIALPVKTDVVALVGLVLFGLGCAPIYPAIMHSTPVNFGKANSQAIVGLQMAFAYVGSMFMPPLFGVIAEKYMGFFPYFMAAFVIVLAVLFAILNKKIASNASKVD